MPGRLTLALGKEISGAPIFADLARMPHLMIAGTTGSGKSVGVNAMILSLLYRLSPDQCRLILIDPKMLELSMYEGIPHLMAPVVTEPAKAVTALKWTVREMERRYRAMSQLGVRNIGGYNERVAEARAEGRGGDAPRADRLRSRHRPPDLRGTAAGAGAAAADRRGDRRDGRPDDGRRQGDRGRGAAPGADGARRRHPRDHGDAAALGRRHHRHDQGQLPDPHQLPGDQQVRQPHHPRRAGRRAAAGHGRHAVHGRAAAAITRVHGPFVSDEEVEKVVAFLREQGEPAYLEEVTEPADDDGERRCCRASARRGDGEKGLFDQAVEVVAREGKASTSFIQRHLNIGYNRAAKLIEQMEKEGVVGPANHVGKREVLVRRMARRRRIRAALGGGGAARVCLIGAAGGMLSRRAGQICGWRDWRLWVVRRSRPHCVDLRNNVAVPETHAGPGRSADAPGSVSKRGSVRLCPSGRDKRRDSGRRGGSSALIKDPAERAGGTDLRNGLHGVADRRRVKRVELGVSQDDVNSYSYCLSLRVHTGRRPTRPE